MKLVNNAESQTSGTTVTTGNSGGTNANAFTTVTTTPANVTLTYSSTHPAHGTNGFLYNQLGATPSITCVEWDSTVLGTRHRLFITVYGYFTTLPTSTLRLVKFLNGTTPLGYCGGPASGTPRMQFRNYNDTTVGTSTSVNAAVNTLYRWEIDVTFGPNGTGTVAQFLGDSTTQDGTSGVLSAGQMGAGGSASNNQDCNKVQIGMTEANFLTAAGSFWLDSINVNDSSLPGPGPYVSGENVSAVAFLHGVGF